MSNFFKQQKAALLANAALYVKTYAPVVEKSYAELSGRKTYTYKAKDSDGKTIIQFVDGEGVYPYISMDIGINDVRITLTRQGDKEIIEELLYLFNKRLGDKNAEQ